MKTQTIGDWCKYLEKNFSPEQMVPCLPVIIRLDGNGFSKYTKGLHKPFDARLQHLMTDTTKYLVQETNAVIGYTQSDEITLVLYSADRKTALYNEGKKQKILSKLTAKTVNYFNERRKTLIPEHNKTAVFDCRIYQVPTLADACTQLLWRENDCIKNSISMLAQSIFSHKELQGLNSTEKINKMLAVGVDWDAIETRFQRGVYARRVTIQTEFTEEELNTLPEKHAARKNPGLKIKRSVISICDLPELRTIANKTQVLFFNEPVILYENN